MHQKYLSCARILPEFLDEIDNGLKFEHVTLWVTVRVLERTKSNAAMVKRQSTEIGLVPCWSTRTLPSVQRRPLRVRQVPA